ncbi:hypothetical protein AAZX31_03G103800 [Glycine max]|uniref:Protein PHYTOCHROME KINASE SUBSTRATE 4 n=2 Tax=Glycine subgen. Soja TaxID=1462606 RepID=K7KEI7_SOYBN|nr:protein PHYTOCHROME KINASE SUBSTRATE 4 [Glycine max]XP_028225109.1 protein PHYTOCHROME KINASE SUBSTRATE 4-like [Glycine soja]KAG5054950.1 hypothetical protein JHK85_007460 [Glycine max]KAG5072037.1 hypothetical protein JHK86_007248 [Glycine max]KAH1069596.1 hypothetical protein GYH30_006977 [Glycine max]KAH1257867.1 Protein PHYTOCHROME KINASE SUBSTRATE 4 [Glycine max]KRH66629.1 hypothetical protein GLYMA_03G118900v4 [Glycine max]|eukprot:XP_006576756.1 protein PHYTOCHROME KINASE SUBSTRATE 4 [Glycine max]
MEREILTKTVRNRDASFSSYLRPDNKATPITTAAPIEDATTELSIFDARKYFNDDDSSNNNNNNANNIQKVSISRVSPMERIPERGDAIITEATRYSSASSSVDSYAQIRNYRAQSFHTATPTASSEASWNSQTGLLSHPPGAIPVSMQNPQNPKNLPNPKFSKSIWLLRRKCPCTGKKSVRVKESTQESKSQISQQERDYEHHNNNNVRNHITPNNWILNQTPAPIPALAPATATIVAAKSQQFNNSNSHRVVSSVRVPFTDGFTFPVLHPNNSISKLKLANVNSVVEEDPPRESLEVFRPPDEPSPNPSPKQLNFPFPAKANVVEDDAASDASSDLFEIESFSTATQSTYPAAYRRNSRDSFDEASATASASASTSTTATATSTATGFFYGRRSMDEGSTTPTITECYEPSEASIEWSVTTAEGHDDAVSNGVVVEEKWKRKGGNGLLVSCRSQKAVSVGPQPVKCGSEGQRNATSSLSSHVNVIGSVNKPPLAHARGHRNAPRVSLAFAT